MASQLKELVQEFTEKLSEHFIQRVNNGEVFKCACVLDDFIKTLTDFGNEIEVESKPDIEVESEEEEEEEEEVKPIRNKDKHGLLIFIDSVDETHTKVHIYKRKNTSYSCNAETRTRIREGNYMLLHLAEKDVIKDRRDQLIARCKEEIKSFKFVRYTGGGQVLIGNDEFHLFERLIRRFRRKFEE
jgi:hypothetical protein